MENNAFNEDIEDLYQNAPFGYLTIRQNGRIVNVNTTLLNFLGYGRAEFVNHKSFQDLLQIGGKIYFETHMIPLLQMQGEFSEINLELQSKTGAGLPVLVNGKSVVSKSNSQPIYRFSILDISQRKLYEKELLIARKNADEKTQKLRQINEELEQFASIASHDLQAPLNTVIGLMSLLKRDYIPQGSDEELYFSLIQSNIERMKLMIKDLLSHSRIDHETIEMKSVSLNEVCQMAIELLQEPIKANQVVFEITKLPTVIGSKIRLVRLFENLFSNAIKYRSSENPAIQVTFTETIDSTTVSIKDNGMGFEAIHAKSIFKFMKRLHGHDQIPGTGIGLASCKKIVEFHKGEIWAKSEPGKGSSFHFSLPKLIDTSESGI
ncbi:sensor histidine kinase [Algoriphagus persicinus]|uniref:sensor histidine kinase n=1 Tax=Algoriphagus persicinus TaxID=3108754 RepID=UPI002B3A6247|nr:ATP-binding protein [Algoriphagus sp. E1-3-M2]MEB2784468.1 ATP-binding protein [Algoriphagus sp. E1-3-M2]